MKKNVSPWIHQLDKDRQGSRLSSDIKSDVAIVGAGIAGISTAFYILKYTDKRVTILEKFKLAHGATGHNAGQVVSYFERGFSSLVEEFGLLLATEGQRAIDDAWVLLDEMYTDAGLNIPLSRFVGHTGLLSFEQVLFHLKNNLCRKQSCLNTEEIRIWDGASFLHQIPSEYDGLYTLTPHKEILELLETEVPDFVASLSHQKGCMNSALFCEEILTYLLRQYGERFAIYEHTPVHKIILHGNNAVIDADTHTVEACNIILCTNGFENLNIINVTGLDIDAKYHHLVEGHVGYMSGYLEKMDKPPIAISYLNNSSADTDESYFYLTRRPYEYEEGMKHNLISIGGPEVPLEEKFAYSYENEYPEEMEEKIDAFIRKIYSINPNRKIDYVFSWHGLMGYTRNRVRLIGPEPKNEVLLYNLGCNGIGILPSIYGGKRVSQYLSGEKLERSIFDVPAIVKN